MLGAREVPPVAKTGRRYGGDGTIHQTGGVDVEIGPDGRVVSVWFRCAMLPFREARVDEGRAASMRAAYVEAPARIVAVEFEEGNKNA